jgi:general secretion pathway protein I
VSRPLTVNSRQSAGFTLLEVVVAVAILAISLTVFLQSEAASLANAGRARDLTIATLLARSKMIDIQQHIVSEGFITGDVEDEGNFRDEGHEEITWHCTISEIELDLTSLDSLMSKIAGDDKAQGTMTSMISGLAGSMQGLTTQMAQSLRAAELTVTWPTGAFKESMHVHAILTREDFGQGAGSSGAVPAAATNPGALPTAAGVPPVTTGGARPTGVP